jgi:ATP-binding cassette, subfamily C, bacterial CydCD
MSSPRRDPAQDRPGKGPLGALPSVARRALAVLAVLNALSLVAQAWALASLLTGGDTLVVLAGAVIARALLNWATQVVAARAAAGAKEALRSELLATVVARGPSSSPASLTVLATKGLDALDGYFTVYLPALVAAAVVPVSVGAAVLFADWPSAVVILVTVPLVPVFAILIGKYTQDKVAASADATARLSGHLLELIRALPVLTAFRRAAAQADAVRRVSDQHRRATLATLRTAFASALVLELVATLSVAVVAVIIGVRLVSGDLTLAVGLFVLILAPECYFPLRAAGAAHHASEDGLEAFRRVSAITRADAAVGGAGKAECGGAVRVRVRDLGVLRRDGFAPDGLSFELRSGEITRLSLPSGGGKSTAIAALLGFVAPTEGEIFRESSDIEAWRRIVAWVPQRPAFASSTVIDELRLAISDRNVPPTREEMREVAEQAVAGHLLDRRIIELSTGERQRVAVARALLRVKRGAKVLLLDEPTAHLDAVTAGRVMSSIYRAAADGVAVLLAAHRKVEATSEVPERHVSTVSTVEEPKGGKLKLTGRMWLGALLGTLALASGIALTATSAWLIAKAAEQPPILTLAVAIVGVRTFGLGRAALRYIERLITHDAAFRQAADLRVKLWQRLVALGPARTAELTRGEGLRRLVDDVDAVRDLTPRVKIPPIVAAAVCVMAVTIQTIIEPVAGLSLAAAALIGGIGAPVLGRALERRATAKLAQERREVAEKVLNLLEALPELIAFGAHHEKLAELKAIDEKLAKRAKRQAFGAGAATGLITLVTGMAALVGATYGNPVLALIPLALAEALNMLPPALQHRDALRKAEARAQIGHVEPSAPPKQGNRISLKGVDVRWPGADEPSLRNVTLDIPTGSHVAVLGPSGAGKSTLLALLLGFLNAERGTAEVPERVAWCPQEPQLVSTTIRENLRLGDPDAPDDQLKQALTAAGLPHWAHNLDRLIGSVSGGEADRLALARALVAVKNADLVVLDEPTAHLDIPTAKAVLGNVAKTLEGRTLVHVTHRPEEAAAADLVIRLNEGRVA